MLLPGYFCLLERYANIAAIFELGNCSFLSHGCLLTQMLVYLAWQRTGSLLTYLLAYDDKKPFTTESVWNKCWNVWTW